MRNSNVLGSEAMKSVVSSYLYDHPFGSLDKGDGFGLDVSRCTLYRVRYPAASGESVEGTVIRLSMGLDTSVEEIKEFGEYIFKKIHSR
jgi:hypothetical protein